MGKNGKPSVLKILIIFLTVLILPAAVWIGTSLIGRISPGAVIPDSYRLCFQIPNPVKLAQNLSKHETLPEILELPEMAGALPFYYQIKSGNFLENKIIAAAARGRLEGALLNDGKILCAWDLGMLSPVLRLLPALAGRINVPGLYYVQGGKHSRFEYRMDDGKVFYAGPYRNLFVITDSTALFESVLDGSVKIDPKNQVPFKSGDFDIACIFSPELLELIISSDENPISAAMDYLQFNGGITASLSIHPRQLDLNLTASFSSNQKDIEKIINRASGAPEMLRMFPENTQYMTLLAAGSLEDLLNAASAIPGSELADPWRKADSSSKSFLGMSIDELLLSWSGSEFAIFGMEGRPAPVIVAEVRDEKKREEIFRKAFESFLINENIKLNLDGNRIPRIELPGFLANLLLSMGVRIPSPYYTVYNGYLFISESAESLLDAVNGIRRNQGLIRTGIWQTLSKTGTDSSSAALFYSLDRSLPFFLNGNSLAAPFLKLYRQGLLRLSMKNHEASLWLSVIPGPGKGLTSTAGFPLEIGGRIGNQIYFLESGNENRIIFTQGNNVIAINPADQSKKILEIPGSSGRIWIVPADGISGCVWIVNSQGRVYLCDTNLEPLRGFPRITALRITAPPAAHGGKLYISEFSGNTASVHVFDNNAAMEKWPMGFDAALLSPLSFLNHGGRVYAACYPKEFLGSIWLLDNRGNPLSGWPIWVSGIAFGSPHIFVHGNRPAIAFVTQAGDLAVYDENGRMFTGFPLELDGVFYIQPVFDGEYLWLVSGNGTLFRVSMDGQSHSHQIPNLRVMEEGYITVFDVDNDKKPEIFISGEGNALYGYKNNFNSLEGFPLPVWGKPAFTVMKDSGKTALAGAGMDNKIYFWQFR